jgi:hypothetical protein
MKRNDTSIYTIFAVKSEIIFFLSYVRGRALIKVYFNYWRQSSRLRHGAVTKHVVTSPFLFLLLLSDFVDYAEICAQRGTVDYCRIIPAEVCLMSRRVRIFTPSLPLEFSLCVLHQLNYTAGWMELFPAVYYYRQPAAPPIDNASMFSNVEHHGNHSVAEARKMTDRKT